jgi:hypothetical protein
MKKIKLLYKLGNFCVYAKSYWTGATIKKAITTRFRMAFWLLLCARDVITGKKKAAIRQPSSA